MNSARNSFFLALALLAFPNVFAANESGELAVVLVDSPTKAIKDGISITLKKAEVVRILEASVDFAIVQRIENPPEWETSRSNEIRISTQPVRVATSVLASLKRFRKVLSWDIQARPNYTACDGSCDFGVSYTFGKDGSFKGSAESNGSESKFAGHLYQYGDLYWARTLRRSDVNRYNVFYTRDSKLICDMMSCQGPM